MCPSLHLECPSLRLCPSPCCPAAEGGQVSRAPSGPAAIHGNSTSPYNTHNARSIRTRHPAPLIMDLHVRDVSPVKTAATRTGTMWGHRHTPVRTHRQAARSGGCLHPPVPPTHGPVINVSRGEVPQSHGECRWGCQVDLFYMYTSASTPHTPLLPPHSPHTAPQCHHNPATKDVTVNKHKLCPSEILTSSITSD